MSGAGEEYTDGGDLREGSSPGSVSGVLRSAAGTLRHGRIESPRLTAELLLAHILGCERSRLYAMADRPLRSDELTAYEQLIHRRLGHEPVQYITGETDFMGLSLHVDRSVLIPRPETEILVEKVVEQCRSGRPCDRILDVGTGSGNIALALARFLGTCRVIALDVGPLDLAVKNVARHALSDRVHLVRGDALSGLPFAPGSFDIVVSNPPYIPAADVGALDPEVRLFESALALTDGADGLSFFRGLASGAATWLRPGGLLAVETAYDQSATVAAIFGASGLRECTISPDLSGVGRVVQGVV